MCQLALSMNNKAMVDTLHVQTVSLPTEAVSQGV